MNFVTPKVFLIADSNFMVPLEYLESIGALDFNHQFDPDESQANLAMFGGKLCYKAFKPGLNPNVTKVRQDLWEYVKNIHKQAHGSVLEHGTATFLFQYVSRVYTHELVRHRVGTAFSQESLRYVRLANLDIWKPDIFNYNQRVSEIFDQTVKNLEDVQKELAKEFGLDDEKDFVRKKFITSHMRRLAPIGLGTSILVTLNMRTLRHLIQIRTSQHAEEEIRLVFGEVAKICKERYPIMFQDFEAEKINGYDKWTTPYASMPYDQEKLEQKDREIEFIKGKAGELEVKKHELFNEKEKYRLQVTDLSEQLKDIQERAREEDLNN